MTSRTLCSLAVVLATASLSLGCSRLFGDDKKEAASFDCERVPSADVEAVVGKLTKPPKEANDKKIGGSCRYIFKDNYVEVLSPPKALYDGVAAGAHAPLTSMREPAFLHAEVSLTVDGLGEAAYLENVNGIEYVLWVKKGSCIIVLKSTIDPALRMADYKKLANAVLAKSSCG